MAPPPPLRKPPRPGKSCNFTTKPGRPAGIGGLLFWAPDIVHLLMPQRHYDKHPNGQ
jgi:hypothetical protein